jgi:hypothetical protein
MQASVLMQDSLVKTDTMVLSKGRAKGAYVGKRRQLSAIVGNPATTPAQGQVRPSFGSERFA